MKKETEVRVTSLISMLSKLGNEHEYYRSRFLALDKARGNKRVFQEFNMTVVSNPSHHKGWFRQEMIQREKRILKLVKGIKK